MLTPDTQRPHSAGKQSEATREFSTSNPTDLRPDRQAILEALNVLFEPGDVVELRAIMERQKKVQSGYFDDFDKLAEAAARYNHPMSYQVYLTLNQVNPDLLARAVNRVDSAGKTTQDADIVRRRWLLIDLDPPRPAGISAKDEELEAARAKAEEIRAYLKCEGWPAPTVAESGNGIHLLYPVDMPNDEVSKQLVEGALKGLGAKFGSDAVEIDQGVFNAARITKAYGTVAKKGDPTPTRPWRLSRIIKAPGRAQLVTPEQLAALHIAQDPKQATDATRAAQTGTRKNGGGVDLDDFLARLGIAYAQDTHDGRERFKLAHCPFNPEHGKGEAAIFRHSSGRLGFKCQHNSCADKGWQNVRDLVDGPREARASLGWEVGERGEKGEKRRHTGDSAGRIAGESGRFLGDFSPEEAKKRAREVMRPAEFTPPPYPVDALGEVLGPAVKATAEAGQMSIAMAGQAFLAAAALLAQGHRNVMSPSGIKPLSLYLLTLAESGDGKSTAEAAALHPIRAWQRRKVEEYNRDLARHRELESSKKKGDPLPFKPLEPYAILKDFTVEGIRSGFQEGRPSQACFTAEGAAILAGHGMTQENRQKTAANLNSLWDDGELSVSRALAGRIQLYGKRFSAHLLIQPDAAREALGDAMLSTMGFWPRFLIAWPEAARARQWRPFKADKLPEVARAWERFTELLRDPVQDDCSSLPVIEFDNDAAQRILKPAFEEFEKQARNEGGDYSHIKPFALRATEQLCRVAGVLAVIDGDERIGVGAATRALALVHYSIDTWRSMAGEREEDERRAWALTLFDWMADHDGFSSESAMLRVGPKKHSLRSQYRRDAALATLELAGLVEREGKEWSITQ